MDKQFAFAVILIILGFGLTQAGGEDEPFLAGLGFGLVVIASVWIAVRIVREYRAGAGEGAQGRAPDQK